MYDFAGQAYTLLIVTVIFGDYYTRLVVADAEAGYRLGNLLWSGALALGYLLAALAAPVLGAIMDARAARKRFLFAAFLVTVAGTALLWLVTPGAVALGFLLIVVSNAAYALGESFVAAFLPQLATRERMGRISGFGWGLGYVGGLVATAFALAFLGAVSAENVERIRWVGPFAAAFFALGALPTFLWLRDRGRRRRLPTGAGLRFGLRRALRTLRGMLGGGPWPALLASVFFSMSGIAIVVSFTFVYGAQVIRWDEGARTAMFVTVQVSAALGAIGFGWVQDRLGPWRVYAATLLLWIAAVLAVWATPALAAWLSARLGAAIAAQELFLAVGVLAGSCLGATQSAGRALVGMLAPAGRAAELFGFWGLMVKLASIVGLLGLGLLQAWLGLADAILFCAALFALAFLAVLPALRGAPR
ncbi:MAG: MFS transporter [Xanthomonadales bacterium]|nr:MFS transporter [Xanthomonadales bacterium]